MFSIPTFVYSCFLQPQLNMNEENFKASHRIEEDSDGNQLGSEGGQKSNEVNQKRDESSSKELNKDVANVRPLEIRKDHQTTKENVVANEPFMVEDVQSEKANFSDYYFGYARSSSSDDSPPNKKQEMQLRTIRTIKTVLLPILTRKY